MVDVAEQALVIAKQRARIQDQGEMICQKSADIRTLKDTVRKLNKEITANKQSITLAANEIKELQAEVNRSSVQEW